MALVSPGVEVTIIDQSQYLPAPTNTIPLFVVATAQNKADASGTAVAAYTTAGTANKLYQITSQRDLVNLYGVPRFYRTANGTPLHGYELNEYGLQAAYSSLGITNRIYVLRADIDLNQLSASLSRPTSPMPDGTYWLNTTNTTWGIYEFNRVTGKFTNVKPIIITDITKMAGGLPLDSIGNIDDYAVWAPPIFNEPTDQPQYFYKTTNNVWVPLGSREWKLDVPIAQGALNPVLNPGDQFTINYNGTSVVTVTVPPIPGNNIQSISDFINNLGWTNLKSEVRGGRLCIFETTTARDAYVTLTNQLGAPLDAIGIPAGTYWTPLMEWGTSPQMPLWTNSQARPRPSGSVWMKVGAAGVGYNPSLFKYNAATAVWRPQTVSLAPSDWSVNAALDSTGGQSIPIGSIYGLYDYYGQYNQSPVYLQERIATGATVSNSSKVISTLGATPRKLFVQTSIPGSSTLSKQYTVTVPANATASDFVVAWTAQFIDYTTATVNIDGTLRLTHTAGGEIILSDVEDWTGLSNGLLADIGFAPNVSTATKVGPGDYAKFYVEVTATEAVSNYITCVSTAGLKVGDAIAFSGRMGGLNNDGPVSTITSPGPFETYTINQIIDDTRFQVSSSITGSTKILYNDSGYVTGSKVTGVGSSINNATFNVTNEFNSYVLNGTGVSYGGQGYLQGEQITILGTALGGADPVNNLTVEVTANNTAAFNGTYGTWGIGQVGTFFTASVPAMATVIGFIDDGSGNGNYTGLQGNKLTVTQVTSGSLYADTVTGAWDYKLNGPMPGISQNDVPTILNDNPPNPNLTITYDLNFPTAPGGIAAPLAQFTVVGRVMYVTAIEAGGIDASGAGAPVIDAAGGILPGTNIAGRISGSGALNFSGTGTYVIDLAPNTPLGTRALTQDSDVLTVTQMDASTFVDGGAVYINNNPSSFPVLTDTITFDNTLPQAGTGGVGQYRILTTGPSGKGYTIPSTTVTQNSQALNVDTLLSGGPLLVGDTVEDPFYVTNPTRIIGGKLKEYATPVKYPGFLLTTVLGSQTIQIQTTGTQPAIAVGQYIYDVDPAFGTTTGRLPVGARIVSGPIVNTPTSMTYQINLAAISSGNATSMAIMDPTPVNGGVGEYTVAHTRTVQPTATAGTAWASAPIAYTPFKSTANEGTCGAVAYVSGFPVIHYNTQISNWQQIDYLAQATAPVNEPAAGTLWYFSTATEADIMVQKNGQWVGYRNTAYDPAGHPSAIGSNQTDPNGPIFNTDAPKTQSDGTPLAYGDLWIDTSPDALENYPVLSRWQNLNGTDMWVTIDTTDQITSNGILFADARWGDKGDVDPVNDPIPSIVKMLNSDYLDLDAPDPLLYPQGTLLFNARRSGYNVKRFTTNLFTQNNYPEAGQFSQTAADTGPGYGVGNLPQFSYTWVTASGNKSNGAAYMGRKAQRAMVVQALRASIDTNTDIRDEDNAFNLIATPAYPECQPNMITLNSDRGETAYIVGDTPMRLADNATDITNWANNTAGDTSTGEDGLVSRSEYMGIYYPSGLSTDLTGNPIAVPASHMMVRTFLRNDTLAYPWLAAAGTRRGTIDNATNIGYINAATGEFVTIKTRVGIRDVLYTNQINPMVFFTGVGLLNYGNKNSKNTSSALDRTNVARLVNYIRRQLVLAARPFIFEPNDVLSRREITGVVQTLFQDLVAKRGIYDFLVVCDSSNNTPARIDRNELWIDIAIEPVKAIEFIYIPVRILNTGELSSL